MQLHEIWRQGYRNRPYLANASDEALAARFQDIVGNSLTLTKNGKIGLHPIDREGEYWMTLFTHLLEEYEARGHRLPSISDYSIPVPTAPSEAKAAHAVAIYEKLKSKRPLVKLGKKRHMQELYELGKIQISPASSYSDPSLNPAKQDNELSFDSFLPKAEVTMTLLDKKTGAPKHRIEPIGDITKTIGLNSDYYVYCMTHTLSYRMFDDFSADACVIIHDTEKFGEQLHKAVLEHLPEWLFWDEQVKYIDPYLSRTDEVNLFSSKHFRYWYQQEYRFIWAPPPGKKYSNKLEPFFFEPGSLKDMAEFVSV